MNKESLKIRVTEILANMGYENIAFSNGEENVLVVTFDSKELTSFIADLPGWSFSGIQLNTSGSSRYKIEFRKI